MPKNFSTVDPNTVLQIPPAPELERHYRGRNVLVTGGAGMIGGALTATLLANGAKVTTVVRHHGPWWFTGPGRLPAEYFGVTQLRLRPDGSEESHQVRIVRGDLADPHFVEHVVEGMDLVFQCAGVPGGSFRVEHDPLPMLAMAPVYHNVLKSSIDEHRKRGRLKYVLLSNASVYPDTASDVPIVEEDAPLAWSRSEAAENPSALQIGALANPAAILKREAELHAALAAQYAGLPVLVIRGGPTYGVGDWVDAAYGHVIPMLGARIMMAAQGGSLSVKNADVRRQFTFNSALAATMAWLGANWHWKDGGPINVAESTVLTVADVAKELCRALGRPDVKLDLSMTAPGSPALNRILDLSVMRTVVPEQHRPEASILDGPFTMRMALFAQWVQMASRIRTYHPLPHHKHGRRV